ncbi:hypothetical protein PSPO01_13686 [Paraphaeosphaeria sporulosa]
MAAIDVNAVCLKERDGEDSWPRCARSKHTNELMGLSRLACAYQEAPKAPAMGGFGASRLHTEELVMLVTMQMAQR